MAIEDERIPMQQWLEKADYEGGILEGFEYGLKADDIQPNIDEHDKLALIYRLEGHYTAMRDDLREVETWTEDEE